MERNCRVDPIIYIPKEWFQLDNVFVEKYKLFDIYWFHWPFDGIAFLIQDYEPVIICKTRTDCCVITRPGWKYKPFSVKMESLILPPEILFDTIQHHPYAKTKTNEEWFIQKAASNELYTYGVTPITANDIPKQFRTGEGHLTALGRTVLDPIEYLKWLLRFSDYR